MKHDAARGAILIAFLLLLGFSSAYSQQQPSTRSHIYPFSSKGLWGFCDQRHKPVIDAQYTDVKQVCQFVMGKKVKSGYWDVYTAQGAYITMAKSILCLNDTSFFTLDIDGSAINAGKNYRNQAITAYSISGPQAPNYKSPAYLQYLNNVNDSNVVLCYNDGRKIAYPFKIVGPTYTLNVLVISQNGKQGIYDFNHDKYIIEPRWKEANCWAYQRDLFYAKDDDDNIFAFGFNQEAYGKLPPYNIMNQQSVDFSKKINILYYGKTGRLPRTDSCYWITNSDNVLVGFKRYPSFWRDRDNGSNVWNSYLTDYNFKPLLNPADNPDSMVHEIANGLFAIYRSKFVKNADGKLWRQGQYISAIYNANLRKIVCTADTIHARIFLSPADNHDRSQVFFGDSKQFGDYTLYIVETPKSYIYIGEKMDTILSLQKKEPGFSAGITYNGDWGFFNTTDGRFQFISKTKPNFIFDQYIGLYRATNVWPKYFEYRQNNKWGVLQLFADPDSIIRGQRVVANDVQYSIIKEAIYDSIKSVNNTYYNGYNQGEIQWMDADWNLIAGHITGAVPTEMIFNNGNRIWLHKNDENKIMGYSIVDTQGRAILHQDWTPRVDGFKMGIVNDSTLIYQYSFEGGFTLIDLKSMKETEYWPGYFVSFVELGHRVIAIKGSEPGVRVSNPMPDLSLPGTTGSRKKDWQLVKGRQKLMFFATMKTDADLYIQNSYFNDCMILERNEGKFRGVIAGDGQVYE